MGYSTVSKPFLPSGKQLKKVAANATNQALDMAEAGVNNMVMIAKATVLGWFKAFKNILMKFVVTPAIRCVTNILTLLFTSLQYLLDGIFGLIPEAGGISYTSIAEMLESAEAMLKEQFVKFGQMGVDKVFTLLTGLVSK